MVEHIVSHRLSCRSVLVGVGNDVFRAMPPPRGAWEYAPPGNLHALSLLL